jgi:hypothetical protein
MCLSVFLFVYLFIQLFNISLKTHLCSVKLVHPSICPFVCLSICICVFLFFVCVSVHLAFCHFAKSTFMPSKTCYVNLSFQMSSCVSLYPCMCLPVCLSACLSVYHSFHHFSQNEYRSCNTFCLSAHLSFCKFVRV